MIILENVHKRYSSKENAKWILQGVSFTVPAKTTVGIIGGTGTGKSTLLQLIRGVEPVTYGKIHYHGRISWPMGFTGGLKATLTGRQNARFICRIHGYNDDIEERLAYIQDFSELGDAFDAPLKTYKGNMKQRLLFAMFIASDFDFYISDGGLRVPGSPDFKKKAIAALKKITDTSGLLMTAEDERTLKQFCSAGIWLHEGQAHWFDDISEALMQHKEHSPQ